MQELEDLHGLSLADLFRTLVLEDATVVALGRKVIEQTNEHTSVFEEGQAPGPFIDYNWDLNITVDDLAYEFVRPIMITLTSPLPEPSTLIVDAATALVARIEGLRKFLTEGQLIAKGTYSQTGLTGEIGRLQWIRKGTLIDVCNSDFLEVVNYKPMIRWTGIWVEVADARAIRGGATNKAGMRVESSAAAIHECTRWLVDVMNASPGERQDTKQTWWERAKAKWPKTLSRRGFDKAWADAVNRTKASAWASAGAPPKSRQ